MKNKIVLCCSIALLTALNFFIAGDGIAQQTPKVALVIGNAAYKNSPLRNPENDARDFAKSLKVFGFTVIERTNIKVADIEPMLRDFNSELVAGSVAVTFYAGHCLQIKGRNYLLAVDANTENEEEMPMQSLSISRLMDLLAKADTRANLVFLDACTFGEETVPPRSLISFAATPGTAVLDGNGSNGLYTGALLQQIKQASQPINQVLKKVASDVKLASKGMQEPWTQGQLDEDFCFSNCQYNLHQKDADN